MHAHCLASWCRSNHYMQIVACDMQTIQSRMQVENLPQLEATGRIFFSAPAEGQQQQLKQISVVTLSLRCTSVCYTGKGILHVASQAPRDEGKVVVVALVRFPICGHGSLLSRLIQKCSESAQDKKWGLMSDRIPCGLPHHGRRAS